MHGQLASYLHCKRLKYNYFYLHVHELGKMSVILYFFFYLLRTSLRILPPFFVTIRHRYININVPYIHTHVFTFLLQSPYMKVFPMKNIKSRDLEATPMDGATSKPIQ